MKNACQTFLIVVLWATSAVGQPIDTHKVAPRGMERPIWSAAHTGHSNIAPWTSFFEDTTAHLLPDAALHQHFGPMPQRNWLKNISEYARSRIWLRFSVDNTAGADTLRLVFFPGMHGRTSLYEWRSDSFCLKAMGGLFVSQPRFAWQANTNCLPLEVPPRSRSTYLVSVSNLAMLYDQVRSELFAPDAYRAYCQVYQERQKPFTFFLAFVIGGLTLLALFGLMQFSLTRGAAYFWYAMFALGNALNFARILETYSDVRWLSSVFPFLHAYTSLPAVTFFYLLFVRYFLNLHLQNNAKSRLMKWAVWVFGVIFFATLITSAIHFSGKEISNQTARIFTFFHLLMLFPSLWVLYLAFSIKGGLSRFVAVGTLLLIFASAFALITPLVTVVKPVHERSPFDKNAAWGYGILVLSESLCFALGLGYKTKLLEAQKREAILEQELQRLRIARDLHDEVGSTLSSISILSASALRGVEKDLDAARFGNIGDKARAALDSISDIVWSVNPENDSMEKALTRMSTYASEMLENVGTEVRFEVGEGVESLTLPMEKRKDFYLIFKEAVHNCAKYARAKQVEVALKKADNALVMSIKDDGVGFEISNSATQNLGGNGLRNMRSRAAAMGGDLAVASAPGAGTEVRLVLPV